MKALNDDIQMRSDWLMPLCTGPERLRNQHGLKLHPTQKPEALLHRVLLASTGAGRHRARPVPRHRHHRGRGAAAAPAFHRHRAPSGLCRGGDRARPRRRGRRRRRAARRRPRKREAPRVPFGSLVERGLIAPGHRADRPGAAGQRDGGGRWHGRWRARRAARSTRSAPRCRTRRPATAGRSGMSSGTDGWCRWTCCGVSNLPRMRDPGTPCPTHTLYQARRKTDCLVRRPHRSSWPGSA